MKRARFVTCRMPCQATYLAASAAGSVNEVVHILGKSDEEIRMDALARQVMAQMNYHAEIVEHGRRSGSVARRCPDTSKLQKLTGFKAMTSLHDGLTPTIEWYTHEKNYSDNFRFFDQIPSVVLDDLFSVDAAHPLADAAHADRYEQHAFSRSGRAPASSLARALLHARAAAGAV